MPLRFFIFGGYGTSPLMLEESLQNCFYHPKNFCGDDGLRKSWNNQLLYYDIPAKEWKEADQAGNIPSPRAATATCYVDDFHKV